MFEYFDILILNISNFILTEFDKSFVFLFTLTIWKGKERDVCLQSSNILQPRNFISVLQNIPNHWEGANNFLFDLSVLI